MKSSAKIRSVSYAKYGYIFIFPFFLVYLIFQLVPLITTFKLSFYGNGKTTDQFVGFENFKALLFANADASRNVKIQHEYFLRDLGNTVILWLGNFIPQIILSLFLAVLFTNLTLKIKGKFFFKVVMYLPNIITAASVAAMFLMIFSETDTGPVNSTLLKLGIIDEAINFVNNKNESRIIIMSAQTWMWFGNTMIMLMSAIGGISADIFEAADIDGANAWQVFTKITVPILKPMVTYVLITSMIGGLQMWDMPYLFKRGQNQPQYTETIAVFIYKRFHSSDGNYSYGYSAAASVILFFITIIIGTIRMITSVDEDEKIAKKQKKVQKQQKSNTFGGI